MGLQDCEVERKPQMTGKIEGTRLTVVKFSHRDNAYRKICLFECECGTFKKIRLDRVQRQEIKSCGCLRREYEWTPEHMQKMRDTPTRLPNLRKKKASTPSFNKGKIRIEDPIGSKQYRYVTESELAEMYYSVE